MENYDEDTQIETILIPEQDILNLTQEEETLEIDDSEEETDENPANENAEGTQQIDKTNEIPLEQKEPNKLLNFQNIPEGETVVVVRNKAGKLLAIPKSNFPTQPSKMIGRVGQTTITKTKVDPKPTTHFYKLVDNPAKAGSKIHIPVKRPASPVKFMKISKVESAQGYYQPDSYKFPDKKGISHKFGCHLCDSVFEDRTEYEKHTNLPAGLAVSSRYCEICKCVLPKPSPSTGIHQCKEKVAENQDAKFFCKRCKNVFVGIEKFDCHYKLHCAKDKIKHCHICDKKFDHPYLVVKHILDFHRQYPSHCRICGTMTTDIEQHIETCELKFLASITDGGVGCLVCQSIFVESHELRYHIGIINLSEQSLFYGCKTCSNIFISKEFLKEHIKLGHAEGNKCDVAGCSEVFDKTHFLNLHKYACHKSEPSMGVNCPTCNNYYLNGKQMECHKIVTSKCYTPRIYKCRFCKDENFKHPYTILKHLVKEHHKTGEFNCNSCGVIFYPPVNASNHKEKCPKLSNSDYEKTCLAL